MVTISYSNKLGKYGQLDDFFNPAKIGFETGSASRVIYEDSQGGEQIILRGDHLSVSKQGVVDGGTITEIDFMNKGGFALVKVTDFELSAKALAATLKHDGFDGLIDLALAGNYKIVGSPSADLLVGGNGKDTINGGAGYDHIDGGKGNDRLTGGLASDQFTFHAGDGKDKITDFDANGGKLAQDYIVTDMHDYTVKDAGENTVIDFGGGDTITLLHVKHTDISDADFIFT